MRHLCSQLPLVLVLGADGVTCGVLAPLTTLSKCFILAV